MFFHNGMVGLHYLVSECAVTMRIMPQKYAAQGLWSDVRKYLMYAVDRKLVRAREDSISVKMIIATVEDNLLLKMSGFGSDLVFNLMSQRRDDTGRPLNFDHPSNSKHNGQR
jgi:hypothetical protein